MKALIVYDSVHGNTEKVANAIANSLKPAGEVKVLRVSDANPDELKDFGLVIVGSPTLGGRPSEAVREFLAKIPSGSLKDVGVTSFDTRIDMKERSGALRFLAKVTGYAAEKIARGLTRKGGRLVAPPQGFFVEGTEGPMKKGELKRADAWAKELVKK